MAVLLVGHVVAGLALLLALGGLAALLALRSVATDVVLAGGDLVGDAALEQDGGRTVRVWNSNMDF